MSMNTTRDDSALEWWQQSGQWAWLHELEQEQAHMKVDDLIPSKYLKQSDIDGEQVVTVEKLIKTNVAREDEDPEYKFVLKFAEFDKCMVLNSTNIKRLGKALGNDTDDWQGGKVVIYVDPDIEYGGKIVGGIRVRGRSKVAPAREVDPETVNRKATAAADEDVPF